MSAKAAFYDVDGTLVRTNIVHTYAYYAMNRGSLTGIAARTLATIAQIPVYAGLDLLKPLITKAGGESQSLGVVVIGTAQGDLHDIGKNLVAMMLEGAGFKVHNLGRDVAPEKFVAAVEEHGAQIVGISALMTTTMPAMKRTIDALSKAGLRERVKVMIGGAPVSQAYADEIGADGYARDSTLAVVRAKELLGVAVAA